MADTRWTTAQRQAIEAETGALLVSAAAGSGKTSVLVERIVRKLTDPEDPCPPEGLLVVTFTNAAAAEMRARIFRRIKETADARPEQAAFLRNLTGRLGEMRVCTMDAFCMQLVREQFAACDIAPDFDILDEGEETALKNAAVRAVIEDRFLQEAPGFLALTRLFDAGRDDAGLIEGVLSLADFSMSEPDPAAWLKNVARQFTACPAAETVWGRLILDRAREGLDYCLTLLRQAAGELPDNEALLQKNEALLTLDIDALARAREALSPGVDWDTAAAAVQTAASALASGRFSTPRGMADDPCKLRVKAKRDEAKDTLGELSALFCATEAENAEDVAALAPAAAALIETVLAFNDRLFSLKRARNRYGFADIEHFALGLLYDPAAPTRQTPLAEALSQELREILIDEYQDTNRAQDALFRALSRNGDNLFMVGDVKQSIYRFRLASPEIFIEKCAAYPQYDGEKHPSKIILGQNFRSRKSVTDTVNFVFSALMSPGCGEIDYTDDERLVFGATQYPESGETDTEVYYVDPGDRDDAAAEAAFCAALIAEKIDGGLTVTEKDGTLRPAGCGDFCVLLRAGKGVADTYAAALRAKGLPVNVDSRAGFFETAEIRMALALLTAIDNPQRDLELLAVMLSPLFGFTPAEAAAIRSDAREAGDKTGALYAAVLAAAEKGDGKCAAFLSSLAYYRKLCATGSAPELLRTLYDETPLLRIAAAMPEGRLRMANLHALAEAAARFSADGAKSIGAFLRYLGMIRENGGELRKGSDAGSRDSVTVMTMHRSKGLEFPFVIVGGLGRRFNLRERSNVLSVSHEYGVGLKRREPENIKLYDTLSSKAVRLAGKTAALSEEMRILYVALTRAKEKLFLLATGEKPWDSLGKTEALLCADARLPAFAATGASAPVRWLSAAFLRHPDAGNLRQLGVSAVPAEGRIVPAVVTAPPEAQPPAPAAPVPADPETVAELRARTAFSYPWMPVADLRAKHTASSLKDEAFSSAHFAEAVPAFLFGDALTPAEKGTATHRFMECCRFEAAAADAEKELRRLVAAQKLSEREAAGVDLAAVRRFFASGLFGRIIKSKTVFRERRFTVAKSVCDLTPGLPETFRDEMTVVDGMTDLIFIEDGEAVIVDYKTDRVPDGGVLAERYRRQMELYREAVTETLGVRVRETLLYSLTLHVEIPV